jgi:hypothetical protein
MVFATFVQRVEYASYFVRFQTRNCCKQSSPKLFSFRTNCFTMLVPRWQSIFDKSWLASEQLMEDRAKSLREVVLVLIVLEKEIANRICVIVLKVLVNEFPSKNRLSATGVS